MSRYSLSLGDIEKIREQIGDKCEICGVGFVNGKFDIDHNHTSGEVRGFLCHNCNMVLGFARDNQTILRNAISYLDKNSDVIPCATPQKAASI